MTTARRLRLRLALSRRAAAHHPLHLLSGVAAALGTAGAEGSPAPDARAAASWLALVVSDAN